MKNGLKIIDCDRHVLEPADLWERYVDPPFKHYLTGAMGGRPLVSGRRMGMVGLAGDPLFSWRQRGPVSHRGGFGANPMWRGKFKHAMSRRFDNVSYLHDMDVEGVDVAVLFTTSGLYFCWDNNLDPEVSAAMCRAYNNWLYDYCALDPDRLKGVCLLPLQDLDLAERELRRAVTELGMVGVFWRPNPIMGRPVSDPAYDSIFAACEELGVAVCYHEGSDTNLPQFPRGDGVVERVDTHFARHAACHPMEQMGAALDTIAGGVYDRFPRLRAAFLESGCGWLPYWLERLDVLSENPFLGEGYQARNRPSEYFRCGQCYLSCEAAEETIPLLGRTIGEDCLMWASDYPHPDAIEYFPNSAGGILESAGLSREFKRRILWDNPSSFYRIA